MNEGKTMLDTRQKLDYDYLTANTNAVGFGHPVAKADEPLYHCTSGVFSSERITTPMGWVCGTPQGVPVLLLWLTNPHIPALPFGHGFAGLTTKQKEFVMNAQLSIGTTVPVVSIQNNL